MTMQRELRTLAGRLSGDLHYDELMRRIYATDASVYREMPLAVALPRDTRDIQLLIDFARRRQVALIPRAGGTSLAGQCVGDGIVVDVSKYMNRILEINREEGWVRLQPGVIRNELNEALQPHGLFFGPNTSTANRAMIGGMVGNNSCGTTSIVYGSTRDHVLELKTVLSDGAEATFRSLSAAEFHQKRELEGLEGDIYRETYSLLNDPTVQEEIRREFPKPEIHRRNTGYAVDLLIESNVFTPGGADFNACRLLCGSEGTLAFTTEIKLHVDPLPLPHDIVVCVHFDDLQASLQAVLVAMAHRPTACELMDKIILDCTKENREQEKNRFFVEGDPAAILMVEFRGATPEAAMQQGQNLISALRAAGLGYAYPVVPAPRTRQVWALRAAGLGVLSNVPGDAKPVACIEDTAVAIADLPRYIREFEQMMNEFGQRAVYYAHAGAGELHLRPLLNLKKEKDRQLFYDITEATARLVKRYRGSLSGEHGDGRVRAAFIPEMIGEQNYQLLRRVKQTWDPAGILNPGKIVDAPPMNESLRYAVGQDPDPIDTLFDYGDEGGILRAAERCNGSGDCRKLAFSGGTMCPSYMATRNEKDTTRARANALREFLTMNAKENPFDYPELKEAMDLCLSCKGCTSECPSNVDMSSMKAEWQYQYQKTNGVPLRSRVFANIGRINGLAATVPGISNFFFTNPALSGVAKRVLGVAHQRSLPRLYRTTLRNWYKRNGQAGGAKGKVYFFCDEFTNYNDTETGIKAIQLLRQLDYEVVMPDHPESGRGPISKGLLEQAREMAKGNIDTFRELLSEDTPLVGVEPSAVLGFRDEFPRLLRGEPAEAARAIAPFALTFEEFIAREVRKGNITAEQFTTDTRRILLHGHCHQKALSGIESTAWALSLPENYTVEVLPSGCCGMAGSFGYEKEHYEMSMKIGELVLFPAVRATDAEAIIAAPGTSCRHQILDGTGRKALHPAEVLWEALREPEEN